MDAVHLMRAATGRDLIIKVEGCYHGHHDSVQVSVLPDADDEIGPADAPDRHRRQHRHPAARSATWSCSSASTTWRPSQRVLEAHPGQIAGMIVEPIMMNAGIIHPEPGYLAGLKELLHAHGALLTFDEVKTGLTAGPGGRHRHLRRRPRPGLPGQGDRRRRLHRRHRRHAPTSWR